MKSTTATGKIKTEFLLQNATSFGGVKIFLAFLEKIKLADAMRSLSGGKARNSLFLLRRFLGGRCPHHSLLYKELIRLGRSCPDLVNELRKLNQEVIRPCLPSDLILDLDSTVETVYGDQSSAAKGTK